MLPITVMSIIVIAILTVLIFLFLLLSYKSILMNYMAEVDSGKHDDTIFDEYLKIKKEQKKKKRWVILFIIFKYLVLFFLICLVILSIFYKINGQVMHIGNNYSFVIASGSMSKFYSTEYEVELNEKFSNLKHLQVGDICFFKKAASLEVGHIYAYNADGYIIIHRLIDIVEINNETLYSFRGDANGASDVLVKADSIIYEYTGNSIRYLGLFILYYQSTLGVYSLINIIIIVVLLDRAYHVYNKINNERLKKIMEN